MKKNYALRRLPLFVVFTVLLCLGSSYTIKAQDTLKNLPELSLPLTNNKLVIAHCMTHIIRYDGYGYEDGCNPNYYPVTGNSSSSIGGYTQVNVMGDRLYKDSTLDQAVEYEMRAAIKAGIDGFQFYYVLGNTNWDNIIKAYFRVADQKNIDFKFAFCISHPDVGTEASKITELASRMNGIINTVGRNNPHWLRTPDGRLITYLWYGEQLATIPGNLAGYPRQFYVARAFRRLGDAIGERLACVLAINDNISNEDLDAYLDYLPAVWLWTGAYTTANKDVSVKSRCVAKNRTYTGSVFNDFYTSKVLEPGTWNIQSVNQAVTRGINNIERKYMRVGLSETFRKQLEFAVDEDVPIMNVITWNDFPEGHHMAPEVNHNYGFAVLLNHYKRLWKGEISPYANRDVAIAFFKKYKNDVTPNPYNISCINIGSTTTSNYEDSIEVVTILTSPGELVVNGTTVNVAAGIVSTRFPYQAGAVNVSIYRNGILTKHFTTPEWITNSPIRTDRLTYTFSSEYYRFHKEIFGDIEPLYSLQYNTSGNAIISVPVIFSADSYNATVDEPLTYTITAYNTPTSFNATDLPAGLALDVNTGVITGSIAVSGVYKTTIISTNAGGTDSKLLTFVVNNPGTAFIPMITSPLTARDSVGKMFTYTITADDEPTSFDATGLPAGLSIDTNTGIISGELEEEGIFNIILSASNSAGTSNSTLVLRVHVIPVQAPYTGTLLNIPGIIEAEDFDLGGEGLAYVDNDMTNNGGAYRPQEGVDIEICSTGGYNVGWTNAGEWIEYEVNVLEEGIYKIDSRVASGAAGDKRFHIELDGENISGTIVPPNTGGWQSWRTITTTTPLLTTGVKMMRIVMETAGYNIDKVTFSVLDTPIISSAASIISRSDLAFSYTITASNLATTYGAIGLPTGLSINTTTGVISGTSVAPGVYNVVLHATNVVGVGRKDLTITINDPVPVLFGNISDTVKVDSLFSYLVTALHNPTSYTVLNLPAGLIFDEPTKTISGTVATAGTYIITINATNVSGTGTMYLTIVVESNFEGDGIVIMPNPIVGGQLRAGVVGWTGWVDMDIISINGALVKRTRVQMQSGIMQTNVSNLSAGTYTLRLRKGNITLVKKFVIGSK